MGNDLEESKNWITAHQTPGQLRESVRVGHNFVLEAIFLGIFDDSIGGQR